MKKICIILAIICISSFIISGIMFATAIGTADFSEFSKSIDEEYITSFDGKNIKIDGVFNNLDIVSYDGTDITSVVNGSYLSFIKKDSYLDINESNSTLKIKFNHNKYLNFISFGPFTFNIDLKVYIPKDYAGSLDIDGVCKTINIANLNLSNLDIDCLSGDINVVNVNTKDLNIKGVSGKINLDSITGDLNINSLSGDIFVKYLEFNNKVNIDCVSSSININVPIGSDFILYSSGIEKFDYSINGIKQQYVKNGTRNPINIDSLSSKIVINEY